MPPARPPAHLPAKLSPVAPPVLFNFNFNGVQEGTRYSEMHPQHMIQPGDVAAAALLPFRLSAAADPLEVVLNRLQTPFEE